MNKTDSKQIPDGWKETTLGALVTFQRGHDLPRSKMVDGSFPIMGSNGIIGFHNQSTTKAPGVTIGRSGNIGRAFLVKRDYWAHNTTLYSKQFHDSDPVFVYYLVKNLKFERFNSGSAVPSLNRNFIHPIQLNAPIIFEQKAIARVLSSLDDKIELLRKQNETLEAIAQTIFKEWFVNFNFPDKNGKPFKDGGGKMIDSELGEIPDGWRVGKLGDEFGILMGQSPPGTSYNEESEGVVFFQGRTDFQERFPKVRLYTTEPKRIAEAFDVLVSVRAPVGDVNVAIETCCIGRGLSSVRGQQQSYTLYKMKFLGDVLRRFDAEGTVFGSISKDDFKSIEVLTPMEEWINSFENTVNPLDQKILSNYKQIQTLTRLRDILLPKLMSGQVRVRM